VTDVWNITVRLTAADGGECVGKTMQSRMGVPASYSLSLTQRDSMADVTLRSASGDYACAFTARMEGDEFTTSGVPATYSCETSEVVRNFACEDGSVRDMLRLGQDLSGRISGNQIRGEWRASWVIMKAGGDLGGTDDIAGLETQAEYTGGR
jgi:hypothetical protein